MLPATKNRHVTKKDDRAEKYVAAYRAVWEGSMARASSVDQMRRRALVGALNHCAEVASYRPARAQGPCPWRSLRPGRRQSYEDGIKKLGRDLAEALEARYPRAFEAANSPAWECVEPERTEHWLRLRMHRASGRGSSEVDAKALVEEAAFQGVLWAGDKLQQVGLSICALRLARLHGNHSATLALSQNLARELLLLAGCPLRAPAARELWRCCDRFVKGTKQDGLYLRFAPNTWSWFAQHAFSVRCACLRMAFRNPYAGELAPGVMPGMLYELAAAVASLELEALVSALSGFKWMTPHERDPPDAATVGMWRPQSHKDEFDLIDFRG